MLRRIMKQAAIMVGLATLLTGIVYPLVMTGLAQLIFPREANGSIIEREGRPVGSALIGQEFTSDGYFWSRPSATTPPYNAAASSGSNLSPTGKALAALVTQRAASLRAFDPLHRSQIPVDLLTASASGLDPDITPAAALYQVPRVAAARKLPQDRVKRLVEAHITGRTLGVLGEPRVNVLELNLALDTLKGK